MTSVPSSLKKEWILHQEDSHVVPAMVDFADERLTLLTATKSTIEHPTKPLPSSPPLGEVAGVQLCTLLYFQPTALLVSKGIAYTNAPFQRLDIRQKERPGKESQIVLQLSVHRSPVSDLPQPQRVQGVW